MSIWKRPVTVEALNALSARTANAQLGIEITEVGDDYLCARAGGRPHPPTLWAAAWRR